MGAVLHVTLRRCTTTQAPMGSMTCPPSAATGFFNRESWPGDLQCQFVSNNFPHFAERLIPFFHRKDVFAKKRTQEHRVPSTFLDFFSRDDRNSNFYKGQSAANLLLLLLLVHGHPYDEAVKANEGARLSPWKETAPCLSHLCTTSPFTGRRIAGSSTGPLPTVEAKHRGGTDHSLSSALPLHRRNRPL